MEEAKVRLYTLGEVIDHLKDGERAVLINGPKAGSTYLYISQNKTLNVYPQMQPVTIAFPNNEDQKGKYMIVDRSW